VFSEWIVAISKYNYVEL